MQVGPRNKPTYGVIGDPCNFYVFVEDEAYPQYNYPSVWIKGAEAFTEYNILRSLFKKDREKFCEKVRELFAKYGASR